MSISSTPNRRGKTKLSVNEVDTATGDWQGLGPLLSDGRLSGRSEAEHSDRFLVLS